MLLKKAILFFFKITCPSRSEFKRSEVEQLGVFDIAITQERVGTLGRYMMYRIPVISQKFRQVLLDLKVKKLEFHPVNLI